MITFGWLFAVVDMQTVKKELNPSAYTDFIIQCRHRDVKGKFGYI